MKNNPKNRKRNNSFSILLSDEEQQLFDTKQRASGLNKTEFFVRMLKGSTIKVYYINETITPIFKELRHQGNNLNQIAIKANSGGSSKAESAMNNMINNYSIAIKKLIYFLEHPLLNAHIIKADDKPASYNPISKGDD
jgi:hypothetical protein